MAELHPNEFNLNKTALMTYFQNNTYFRNLMFGLIDIVNKTSTGNNSNDQIIKEANELFSCIFLICILVFLFGCHFIIYNSKYILNVIYNIGCQILGKIKNLSQSVNARMQKYLTLDNYLLIFHVFCCFYYVVESLFKPTKSNNLLLWVQIAVGGYQLVKFLWYNILPELLIKLCDFIRYIYNDLFSLVCRIIKKYYRGFYNAIKYLFNTVLPEVIRQFNIIFRNIYNFLLQHYLLIKRDLLYFLEQINTVLIYLFDNAKYYIYMTMNICFVWFLIGFNYLVYMLKLAKAFWVPILGSIIIIGATHVYEYNQI